MNDTRQRQDEVTDAETVEVPGTAQLNVFALNVVLALAWSLTTGAFSLLNLTVGFVLAFLALWLPWRMWGDDTYFRRPWRIVRLMVIFVWELVVSASTVAMLVLTPGLKFRSAIVAVPLGVKHDLGVTLFANLISLTPGTLSLDVSDDRSTLYVHAMDTEDAEAEKRNMKETFEDPIRKALK
jgi:multicomponent Na+:H+ antiporter subunit E